MAFFHGGKPGLQIGDVILPPTASGVDMDAKYGPESGGNAEDRGRVFISRDPRHAAMYANSYPLGDVYEVIPLGQRGRDHDFFIKGLSQWCESARIVRVTRRGVHMQKDGKLSR